MTTDDTLKQCNSNDSSIFLPNTQKAFNSFNKQSNKKWCLSYSTYTTNLQFLNESTYFYINQASNRIRENDLIYMYDISTEHSFNYKCTVIKTKLTKADIENEFDRIITTDCDDNTNYYIKVEPEIKLTGNAYRLKQLEKYGFNERSGIFIIRTDGKLDEYLTTIEDLQNTTELNADKYDASYALIKHIIKQYENLPSLENCDFNDLDLIYFSVIGTWKCDINCKKDKVNNSHLSEEGKQSIKKLLDELWSNTVNKIYIHSEEEYKTNMCMFGTGIGKIGSSSQVPIDKAKQTCRKFIQLCIEVNNTSDENTALDLSEKALKNGIHGLAASSVSFILHCLKPYYFPIFIRQKDSLCIYSKLGIDVSNITSEKEYINNTRKIKAFRDSNFKWKNYRILDLLNININYLQKFYNEGIQNRSYVFTTWYNEYKEAASRFKKCCEQGKWEHNDLLDLLKNKTNGISDLSQGNYFNNEIDKIITNWNKFEPLINKIGKNQKMTGAEYDKLKALFGEYTEQHKISALHRVIASILPGVVTTIMNKDALKAVFKDLSLIIPEFPEYTDNWLTDNINFIKYCKKNVHFNEPWHVSLFSWYLYEYRIEDKKRMEEEMEQLVKYKEDVIRAKNIIFTGAPGTGKTHLAQDIAKLMNATYEIVQFHPSYDYTDFVEGLRPVSQNGNIVFKRMDGVFMSFCREAIENPNEDYVLIIDEINRGEVSKIFGEIFYAIDLGYRGKKENGILTQYNNLMEDDDIFKKNGFYVPSNVYIIGTMNDIDRSVESIDFAFRRRFTWKEITAESSISILHNPKAWSSYGDMPSSSIIKELEIRLKNLNNAISKSNCGLNSSYHIGASYLLRYASYDPNDAFNMLWNNHLKGVLAEYLRGRPNIENILTDFENAFNKSKNNNTQDEEEK